MARTAEVETADERPLRSDAAANRDRIVTAAAAAFAEHGSEASMDDIAHRAGVGVGTVYRRFPTKAALADHLACELITHVRGLAERSLAEAGFEDYVWGLCGLAVKYGRALRWLLGTEAAAGRLIAEVRPLVARMIGQAQTAGQLRTDVTATDVNVLLWSLHGVTDVTREVAPQAWRRHVETVLTGWRAVAAPPFAAAPVSQAVVDRMAGRR